MPTHYRGTDHEIRSLNLFISLMRVADGFTKMEERMARPFGLKPGGFGALEVLLHLGPMGQKTIE